MCDNIYIQIIKERSVIIMFCSKCGKEIDDTSKFCNYCGNKILTENDNTKPIKQHKKAIIFLTIGLLALCIIGIFIFQILSKPKIIELNKDNFQDYIIFVSSVVALAILGIKMKKSSKSYSHKRSNRFYSINYGGANRI